MDNRLDLLSGALPGFGYRSLTLTDGLEYCERRGYRVFEIPLREHFGITRRVQGSVVYIALNSLLDPAEKTVTIFHELWHLAADSFESTALRSFGLSHDRQEQEAEALALAAYIPRYDAEWMTAGEIVEAYGVRPALAELRLLALIHYDI